MGDRFKKVQAGQSLEVSATAWNAFIDAAQKAKNAQHDELSDGSAQFRQADIIKIRNDSGADLPRFSVLGLDAPIFAPAVSLRAFQDQVALKGVIPTEEDHFGRFAILLEPAGSGRIARAWASGVCQARVNVEDEDHSCADVTDGDPTKLTSAKRGAAQMLWREGGTGDQWAIVRFGTICAKSTSDTLERCDCPEATYEVTPDCVPCNTYGKKMPKYWWLDILLAEDNAYSEAYCEGTNCESIPRLVKLKNETDSYGKALCLWTGEVACFSFELSQSGDYYYIRIFDTNDCLLATLRKPIDEFNCCGVNENWELVAGSVCNVQVRLRPHECTCCDELPCPPPGESICPEQCDCDGPCIMAVAATGDCPVPTCPTSSEGGCDPEVCESIPGCKCINGECVQTIPGCGVEGGAVKWVGGCTWHGRHENPGRDVTVEWTGSRWEVRIVMDCGTVAVFYRDTWDCWTDDAGWQLDEEQSHCHYVGVPTNAGVRVMPAG
jgi:hypothetical protein